jgi:hypothetical protein
MFCVKSVWKNRCLEELIRTRQAPLLKSLGDISGNSFLMKCFDSSGILNYAFGGGPMRKIIVLLLVLSISLVVPASTSADEMSPQRDFCSSVGISAGMMMPFGLTCQQWIDPIGFRLMAGGLYLDYYKSGSFWGGTEILFRLWRNVEYKWPLRTYVWSGIFTDGNMIPFYFNNVAPFFGVGGDIGLGRFSLCMDTGYGFAYRVRNGEFSLAPFLLIEGTVLYRL